VGKEAGRPGRPQSGKSAVAPAEPRGIRLPLPPPMSASPTAPDTPSRADPARDSYFEKSFHASPALMSIARAADGVLLEINDAFARASGYSRDEALGHTTLELGLWLRLEQRDHFLKLIRSVGQVRDYEAEFRNRHGEHLSLLLNADLFDLRGQPCMLTVGVDITDRRRRDQVQAATYRISRAVLAGGDLPALFAEVHRIIAGLMPAENFYVALVDDAGTELSFPYFVDQYVTAAPSRPLGNGFTELVLQTAKPLLVTAEELATRLGARGVYLPLDRPASQRIGAPLLIGERAIGVIALQDYGDSRAYDARDLELLTFVAEQTAAAVHRRQAEAALERAEQNYRSIFFNALEGLYVSSPQGKFLRANPALARMFGYASPEELVRVVNDIGRQMYVEPGRREEFFQLIKNSDEIADFESEVYRQDGSRFWISESVRVMRNADGSIAHFEGIATDITQKREAARALQAAKDAADAASRAKSYFLASVSHELRTPLNGILGYTQILRRDPTLGEKQREGLGVIHESADHLLALINDVLDLSKIEAGRIELHPIDFNLLEFAASVERAFTTRAREKTLLFETARGANLPMWVRGDEQRLRQIVFNLVGNAVKFTSRGGVVFSVMPGETAGTIRFSVSDTGPGISEQDIGRLFEPFTQASRQNPGAVGTGLGLAISRSLVEKMGGRLQVESTPGWGSRFWFDVPLPTVEVAPVEVSASRRVVGYDGPRRRVLVVDDNNANRAVLTAMLTPLGFDLVEAADGAAAVARFLEQTFDLVLMDLRLPGGVDGLEATRQIRAQSAEREKLKIIAVSASAYDIDRQECFDAGCDDFLAKPFREEELWSAIERALGLRWIFGETDDSRTPFPSVVYPPTAEDAAALYDLAAQGDVVGIRARAQAMLAGDAKLAPFAQGVLDLAARFKMKAIRQFVSRYLPANHG
jgi:PAS domain S-box-containing protein